MNWKVSAEEMLGTSTVALPELDTRPAFTTESPEGDWLCAWCLNRVANEQDRFRFEGKDEFTFTNPANIRFNIITFSDTRGCRQTGNPTLEHTWFPGHAWSYCQCQECGQHLGWFFTGQYDFAGLIRDRIVRALYLKN